MLSDPERVTEPLQVSYSSPLKSGGRATLLQFLPTTVAHDIIHQATLLLVWILTNTSPNIYPPLPLPSTLPHPLTLPIPLKTDLNDTICRSVTLMKGRKVTQGRDLWKLASLCVPGGSTMARPPLVPAHMHISRCFPKGFQDGVTGTEKR